MLISDRHRGLYEAYYRQTAKALPRANRWLDQIEEIAEVVHAQSILDYGCGDARGISQFSRYDVYDYDPAVAECSDLPSPADLVVSVHMLEHVEAGCIAAVLEHMESLAKKALLIVVSCEASSKTLPDGSPWHCFVKDTEWWQRKLSAYQPYPTIKASGKEYAALRVL